jgi:hypothetical protein
MTGYCTFSTTYNKLMLCCAILCVMPEPYYVHLIRLRINCCPEYHIYMVF